MKSRNLVWIFAFFLGVTTAKADSTSSGLVQSQQILEKLDLSDPGSLHPSALDQIVTQLDDAARNISNDASVSRFTRQRTEQLMLQAATRLLHRHAEPGFAREVVESAAQLLDFDLASPRPQIRKLAQARADSLSLKASEFSNERSGFHLDRNSQVQLFSFPSFIMSPVPICDSDDP